MRDYDPRILNEDFKTMTALEAAEYIEGDIDDSDILVAQYIYQQAVIDGDGLELGFVPNPELEASAEDQIAAFKLAQYKSRQSGEAFSPHITLLLAADLEFSVEDAIKTAVGYNQYPNN